jgi:hypothetical protein
MDVLNGRSMPFLKPYPNYENPSGDGRNLNALAPLYYTADNGDQYRTMVGADSDGASGPSPVWSFIPPNGGPWYLPSRLHDAGYRCELEKWMPSLQKWQRVMLPKASNDLLLKEAMLSTGVDMARAIAIYEAVAQFGNTSFSEDLAKPIPPTNPANG